MGIIRVQMAVGDGLLTAFKNRTNSAKFDRRGGWSGNFSVDLQQSGGGGGGWNGASWRMFRTAAEAGVDEPDWESFLADVVQDAKHNTGIPNVSFISAIHEDETPGLSPHAGFDALMADVAKKPWELEVVPAPPPF